MGNKTTALHATFTPKAPTNTGGDADKIEKDVKDLHKKKTGRKKKLEGVKYRTTTLEIEESLYIKMKNVCFFDNKTMAEYIGELIEKDVNERK